MRRTKGLRANVVAIMEGLEAKRWRLSKPELLALRRVPQSKLQPKLTMSEVATLLVENFGELSSRAAFFRSYNHALKANQQNVEVKQVKPSNADLQFLKRLREVVRIGPTAGMEEITSRCEHITLTEMDCKCLDRPYTVSPTKLSRDDLATLFIRRDQYDYYPAAFKSLQRALKGERVSETFLGRLSEVLDMPFDRIWVPDERDDPNQLAKNMCTADRRGNYAQAEMLGEYLVERQDIDKGLRNNVTIELARVYDHGRQWEKGRKLLEGALAGSAIVDALRPRAEYQRAVLVIGLAQDYLNRTRSSYRPTKPIKDLIRQARVQLRELMGRVCVDVQLLDAHGQLAVDPGKGTGADLAMAVAAYHQLSLVELLEGNFQKALEGFQECLKVRLKNKADTFLAARDRLAYEYRRMGQCQAHLGCMDEAAGSFREALLLLSGHDRYRKEVERDQAAWEV